MSRRQAPVVVTGGTGFVGGYMSRALLVGGREVVALTRGHAASPEMAFLLDAEAQGLVTESGSVGDLGRLEEVFAAVEPAAVVHAASNVDVAAQYRDPLLAFRDNLAGTINVLEAARRTDVERVVFVSSIGVLPPARYEPIDAAHPIILESGGPGAGAYGAAKAAGELFAFAYEQAYGLDVRIVRPSAVYGFGMPSHSPNYMKEFVEPAVRREKVSLPSGGRLPRDYTHVLDVAELTTAVLNASDDADRIFYAATGRPLVLAAEVAELVRELVPGAEIEVADTMTPDDEVEASFRGVLSVENARQQLGWTPRYAKLRDGVSQYIDRYRAYVAATES